MSGPRRILVRSTNWIGDAVMSEPALRALAGRFPGAAIDVLATPWVGPLFHAHPACREVIPLDRSGAHRNLAARLFHLRGLAPRRYDLGVLFPNSLAAALELSAAGCRRILGYRGDGRSWLLTDPVERDANLRVGHEIYFYLKLVARLGASTGDPVPRLPLAPGEAERAEAALEAAGLSHPVIGFAPGAAFGPAKMWGEAKFRALAALLHGEGFSLAAFGGPADAGAGEAILAGLPGRAANFAGRTSLREFFALASRCAGFVSNDSGPMHAAAALGTPTVGIFGSTDPVRTGPIGRHTAVVRRTTPCAPCKGRVCRFGHRACLEAIGPEEVRDRLLALVARARGGPVSPLTLPPGDPII